MASRSQDAPPSSDREVARDLQRQHVDPHEISLVNVCHDCQGECCVGRTLVLEEEATSIAARTGRDHFTHHRDGIFYLERGPCPYLQEGLCSVQSIKPLICQIYPFVPRVVDGEPWLFAVGECSASRCLNPAFVHKAKILARKLFDRLDQEAYEKYWETHKVGDFDDERVVFRVRVNEASSAVATEDSTHAAIGARRS